MKGNKIASFFIGICVLVTIALGISWVGDKVSPQPKKEISLFSEPQTSNSNLVFDLDADSLASFSVDSVGGIAYINSYTDNSYTISSHPNVTPTLRPFLDSVGIRFQENNFSLLYRNAPISHKQLYILLKCSEAAATYDVSNGNPFYASKNTATVPLLWGAPGKKGIYHVGFPSGTTGFITSPDLLTKYTLNQANNTNPLNAYRLVCLTFPSSSFQNCLYLGAGTNTGLALALRPWNGHIKRALFYEEPLSQTEQDSLISALRTQYIIQ